MEALSLTTAATLLPSALAGLVALATLVVRAARVLARRRREAGRARLEPHLYRALETGRVPRALRRVKPRELPLLSELVVELLGMLRGNQQEGMVRLAHEVGLVTRDLRQLYANAYQARARAAENLGFYGGPEHAGHLSSLLEDPEEVVRGTAARALSRIGTPEAAEALAAHLSSDSEVTSLRMAENLERFGELAWEGLAELLSSEEEADRRGQAQAARILGNLRLAEARPALRAVLGRRWNTDLRAQATLALGMIGHPADVPALLLAARDGSWPVRVQAARALGLVGDVETIPVLRVLAIDDEWWVRVAAAQALANLGEPGEEALRDVLATGGQAARENAAEALESRSGVAGTLEDVA